MNEASVLALTHLSLTQLAVSTGTKLLTEAA